MDLLLRTEVKESPHTAANWKLEIGGNKKTISVHRYPSDERISESATGKWAVGGAFRSRTRLSLPVDLMEDWPGRV